MIKSENSRKYFTNLLNVIRSGFITSLFNETIQAVHSSDMNNGTIPVNWCNERAKRIWMPDCKNCGRGNYCFWLKIFALRHGKSVKDIKQDSKGCPVRNIRDFLDLKKENSGELTLEAKSGLHLMIDFLNIWIWFADQVNGTVYIAMGTPLADTNDSAYNFLKDQLLYIGKGSTGYALQRGKGICMTDTVIDPKGFSVFRNIISHRLSSLAVPIKESEEKSRIIAYISLSYPVINAWHPGTEFCSGNHGNSVQVSHNPAICFYKKFEEFLESGIVALPDILTEKNSSYLSRGSYHDLIRYGCESELKDRLYEKLSEATLIQENAVPELKNILEKLCISGEAGRDGLGIIYSSLWEKRKENTFEQFEQKECIIKPEIAFSTFSKMLIGMNRHKQERSRNYKEEFLTGIMGINKEHIQEMEISLSGNVSFRLVFKSNKDRLFRDIQEIVEDGFNSISDKLSELIESVAAIGIRIYREACFYSSQPVEQRRIDLLRQKLNRTLCKIFVRHWWAGDQQDYVNDMKNILKIYQENLANLEQDEEDHIIEIMKEIFSRNMLEKIPDTDGNRLLYVHIWLNMEKICKDNPEKGYYRLASEDKFYRIQGHDGKQDFILAHLRDHTVFKVLAHAFVYFREEEPVDIREGQEVLSTRWSGFFSDYYDFFTFIDISGDGSHKCGLLYKGDRNKVIEFSKQLKEIYCQMTDDPVEYSRILDSIGDNPFPEAGDDPWVLFHVEKAGSWYYIHIRHEKALNNLDEMKDGITGAIFQKKTDDMVKKISRIPETDGCLPLFYWNRYGTSGKEIWLPFKNDTAGVPAEELDQCRFASIGIRSLFMCRFGNYILLMGRSLYHPEQADEYSIFNPAQNNVIRIFKNIIEAWFKYQEIYKVKDIKDCIRGTSVEIRGIREMVKKAARFPWPVLIIGETGVGKEVVARAIHENSGREGAFVTVNCGAIPETLIESELFGQVKGAYTEAADRPGKFEEANHGTIFLDEIGEASQKFQTALLRVLENKDVQRIGANVEAKRSKNREEKLDVRVICATNKTLEYLKGINGNTFRKDMFYRISALVIKVPPLRDRKDDIPELVEKFIGDFNRDLVKYREPNSSNLQIPADVIKRLECEDFAGGNVRELRNILQSAIMMSGKIWGNIEKQDIEKAIRFSKEEVDYKESAKPEKLRMIEEDPLEYFRKIMNMRTRKPRRMEQTGLDENSLYQLEKRQLENLLMKYGSVRNLATEVSCSKQTIYDWIEKLDIVFQSCKGNRSESP